MRTNDLMLLIYGSKMAKTSNRRFVGNTFDIVWKMLSNVNSSTRLHERVLSITNFIPNNARLRIRSANAGKNIL